MPVAGHDVEHTFGQAGFDRQFGQPQRGERSLLAGFEHHAVARSQRGAEFPGGHQQRVVPRHDGAHHPHGLAGDERQRAAPCGSDLVVDLVDGLAVPGDAACAGRHVDAQAVADGLAHVQRFKQCQLVLGGENFFGKAHQDLLAHGRRLVRPAAVIEGAARRGHGRIDVWRLASRHLRDGASVDRRDAAEGLTSGAVAPAPVDEQPPIGAALGGQRVPVARSGSHRQNVTTTEAPNSWLFFFHSFLSMYSNTRRSAKSKRYSSLNSVYSLKR